MSELPVHQHTDCGTGRQAFVRLAVTLAMAWTTPLVAQSDPDRNALRRRRAGIREPDSNRREHQPGQLRLTGTIETR